MYYYIATGYNANAASDACMLKDASNSKSLAVLHYDTLRFYQIKDNEPIYDFTFARKEKFLFMLRIPFESYDSLLLVNKDYAYYLIRPENGSATVVSAGSLKKDFPERGDGKVLGIHCRNKQYAVLSLYNSIIDILSLAATDIDSMNSFIMLIEYEHVLDMADLSSPTKAQVGFLVRSRAGFAFCIYELLSSVANYTQAKPLTAFELPMSSFHRVVALDANCFLSFSTEQVYLHEGGKKEFAAAADLPEPAISLCYTFVEDGKLLVGTSKGKLWTVLVESGGVRVNAVGEIPYPSGIAHIGKGIVYICSVNEDNVLLDMERREVLRQYENLACIADFALQRDGRGEQIVACCNHLKYSEICVLKKGFSLKQIAAIPMQMVVEIWSAASYLIVGLISETRVFRLDSSSLSELIDLPFLYSSRTLLIAEFEDTIIQVTESTVRVYSPAFALLQSRQSRAAPIVHAAASSSNFLSVCEADNSVHVYAVRKEHFKLVTTLASIGCEVSAMAFTDKELVVGTWESTLEVYDLENGKQVSVKVEGSPVRSMVYCGGLLVCGNSDGYLAAYCVEGTEVKLECCTVMGIKEVKLKKFPHYETPAVVALSDTATLITINKGKLNYLPFMETEDSVQAIEQLSAKIVLATSQELSVNALHSAPSNCRRQIEVQSKFQARKIVCDASTGHMVVLGDEGSDSKLLVLSGVTYKCIDSYSFPSGHMACSVMITDGLIEGTNENVIFVGVAIDSESTKGKLVSFVIRNDKLKILSKNDVNGFVLALAQYNGYILCSVNAAVFLFGVENVVSSNKITEFSIKEINHAECVRCSLITFIQVNGNIAIVGDMTSFIGVLKVSNSPPALKEVSMHPRPFWAHCGLFVDAHHCLVAISNQLCAVRLDFAKRSVEVVDSVELSQDVTQIRRTTFVDDKLKAVFELKALTDKQLGAKDANKLLVTGDELVYSTNFGSVGALVGISEGAFRELSKVERALLQEEKTQAKSRASFVNGDVVEKLLKMSAEKAREVYGRIESPKPALNELLILIGQLMLIH